MEIGTNLTAYDFLVMGLLLLLIGRGLWLGFLKQVIGLIALYLGYIVASQYHDRLFPFLRDFSENPKVIFFCSYALLFVVAYLLAVLLGKALHFVIQRPGLCKGCAAGGPHAYGPGYGPGPRKSAAAQLRDLR
jgi:membrane protein required for colicin V production